MSLEDTKKRALRILGKRNFSESEMHKRLVSKGEPEEAAAETVKWLVELGYINDGSYADLIVNHYAAKGYGEARIRDELYKRGVPREMWDEKLESVRGTEQADAVNGFLRKKLGRSRLHGDDMPGGYDKDELRRATEALVRRGFSYDEAKETVDRYLEENG